MFDAISQRERETERDRERQTNRQTDKQTETEQGNRRKGYYSQYQVKCFGSLQKAKVKYQNKAIKEIKKNIYIYIQRHLLNNSCHYAMQNIFSNFIICLWPGKIQ